MNTELITYSQTDMSLKERNHLLMFLLCLNELNDIEKDSWCGTFQEIKDKNGKMLKLSNEQKTTISELIKKIDFSTKLQNECSGYVRIKWMAFEREYFLRQLSTLASNVWLDYMPKDFKIEAETFKSFMNSIGLKIYQEDKIENIHLLK